MKRSIVLMSAMLLYLTQPSSADVPTAFSWVNLESDTAIMSVVRHALRGTSISAIREVGVEDGFALAMTISRDAGAPTPDYDQWSIFSISLASGQSRLIISGYGIRLLDWIGSAKDELAVTYYSCWECEPSTVFTTLHFVKTEGWKARWAGEFADVSFPQPGAVVLMTGVGDPYDDDEVEQVFSVVKQPNGGIAVGRWVHSRNTQSGKIGDEVMRYFVDPAAKEDRIETLNGSAAFRWKREICAKSNISMQPSIGQDTKACRGVIQASTLHRGTHT